MSKKKWNLIKHSKRFYVRVYRRAGTFVLFFMSLNVCLAVAIWHVYINLPQPTYYATFGKTPPVPLFAMDTPNYSSVPLLADDPYQDSAVRVIPK